MDTVLAEFNRRKSEHNHTGRVIDTNFQSVILSNRISLKYLIIEATFYFIKQAFLLMKPCLLNLSCLIITLAYIFLTHCLRMSYYVNFWGGL